MWPTSDRFDATAVGSHRAVSRAVLCDTVQFGAAPTGIELPILGGDVRLSGTSDIKGTLSLTTTGDYWARVQPFGSEVFVERGIDFGDGTREMVPLGYFRIDDASQGRAPSGPIVLSGSTREAQMIDNRVVYPLQIPPGSTHRTVFEALVNGVTAPGAAITTYPVYIGTTVPISWESAGYDPDAVGVSSNLVVEEGTYDFLAKLVDAIGCVLRFAETGELHVVRRDPATDAVPAWAIRGGATGTLIRASRKVTRDGVYNLVRAVGSDPAVQTGYRLAYINDPVSPLFWSGRFGAVIRYYASPLLQSGAQADAAAETILSRVTGLPTELSLFAVPHPALRPIDVITSTLTGSGQIAERHVIDDITIPLVGDAEPEIKTRTLHTLGGTGVTDPDDPSTPGEPTDPDPGTGPGDPDDPGDPGEPDPTDGTQVAVVRGWGSIVDGDEFDYTGAPNAKWGLYDGAGHDGNGTRSPAAFSVHDGIMTVHGENGQTGGTAFQRGEMGSRVEIRARVYNTAGGTDRFHPVLILWPDNDDWPGGAEYDFMECDEGTGRFGLFMHLPNHEPYRQDGYEEDLDLTVYHNYACEWNPSARTLKAWIDGREVYSGAGRVADAPGPMHLTIQLDHFGGNPRPANFDIAWVRIYQRPNA